MKHLPEADMKLNIKGDSVRINNLVIAGGWWVISDVH